MTRHCHTYWGSHGCSLPPGHDGWCVCESCGPPGPGYVGAFPYYGEGTKFYGEDAPKAQARFDQAYADGEVTL